MVPRFPAPINHETGGGIRLTRPARFLFFSSLFFCGCCLLETLFRTYVCACASSRILFLLLLSFFSSRERQWWSLYTYRVRDASSDSWCARFLCDNNVMTHFVRRSAGSRVIIHFGRSPGARVLLVLFICACVSACSVSSACLSDAVASLV